MGTPKALLKLNGETFLDRLIRLLSPVCHPLIVVVGRDADPIRSGIQRARDVVLALNPDPERGMLSSLQCGLPEVPTVAEAIMFTPVDHPALRASTVTALAEAWIEHRPAVAAAAYRGERGHPVCVARALIAEFLALPPTAPTNQVTRRYDPLLVEVEDPGVVADVDDPDAYRKLVAARESASILP
jgi:molybdenum cofactor cytidylyltransferase